MRTTKPILIENILLGVFWVLAVVGFVGDELISAVATYRSAIMLLCDAVLVGLGVACLRHRSDLVMIISLLVIVLVSNLAINGLGVMFTLNGLRDFIGAMFCYPIFRYFTDNQARYSHFVKRFDEALKIFLFLQAFCITYQFVRYGAGDAGGGSLGNWYSGIISMLIYLISFYLLHKRIVANQFWTSLWRNKVYIILLFPTFLNETKISFVLLPLYFVLLMPIDKRIFLRAIVIVPLMSLLFVVGYAIYKVTYQGNLAGTAGNANIFSEEYLIEYMLMDIDDAEDDANWNMENSKTGVADIPRITKFLLLAQIDEENPGHIAWGFGVGQFKGGTQIERSQFYNDYEWYLLGTIPYAIHVYIQLGVVGMVWIIVFLITIFVRKPSPRHQRDWNLQLYLALLLMMNFFYIEALRDPIFCLVTYGLVALSWLPPTQDATAEPIEAPA